MKPRLSLVVITKNEERNIETCLRSAKDIADEIVVVDDHSQDATVSIAGRFTEKIFTRAMDNEGRHRNFSLAQATGEWVLILDAAERLTEPLRREIRALLETPSPPFNAYAIPRKNFIADHWVRYGGWYPSAQLRLFKNGLLKYEESEVHCRVFMDGQWGTLKNPMDHFSYRDFSDFITKLNRQTTLEASKWIRDKRKMSLMRALRKSVDRFLRTFLFKKGYKDGFVGFMVAVFSGLYQLFTYAKYWQEKKKNNASG